MTTKLLRVAAVKFGGLATGGTEKWLQTICANLPKDRFAVDFYYCDSAPYIGSDWVHPDTDVSRLAYMTEKGINLVKFKVGAKNVTVPSHDWVETNFWDLFKQENYDLVLAARAGHKEYPFYLIDKTPIVEFITLAGMSDNQKNIRRSVHISEFQMKTWIASGGDATRASVVPLFAEQDFDNTQAPSLREKLGIAPDVFVFGLHQRPDDGIFSPVPLEGYSKVETDKTAFVLMGGSNFYVRHASELQLKHFYRVPPSGDIKNIKSFLDSLNVYAHGRKDGETFSLAIAEAMSRGLPVVSHVAPAMGHVETIGNAGVVAKTIEDYVAEMARLITDTEHYTELSNNARERFQSVLSLETNINKITNLLETVCLEQVENDKLETMSGNEFWETVWD